MQEVSGNRDSIPGLGRSLRGGQGSPLWCSCLENPMDRGAQRATVHGIAKSQTQEATEQAQEFFIGFPGGSVVKNLPARRQGFDPWVRKIPWRRKWLPIPVLLPGKSHGQRSLVGYSPWDCQESDATVRTHTDPLWYVE